LGLPLDKSSNLIIHGQSKDPLFTDVTLIELLSILILSEAFVGDSTVAFDGAFLLVKLKTLISTQEGKAWQISVPKDINDIAEFVRREKKKNEQKEEENTSTATNNQNLTENKKIRKRAYKPRSYLGEIALIISNDYHNKNKQVIPRFKWFNTLEEKTINKIDNNKYQYTDPKTEESKIVSKSHLDNLYVTVTRDL